MAPWVEQSGTLEVLLPKTTFEFRHHTYQEYLTAMALARRLVGRNERLEREARNMLREKRFAPLWSEPMRMLAGALLAESEAGLPDGQPGAKAWVEGLADLAARGPPAPRNPPA